VVLVLGFSLGLGIFWLFWSPWPDPASTSLPWKPDLIVILGGGDDDRVREGKRLADEFPEVKVVVTGDGGMIRDGLRNAGLSEKRMEIEPDAESTYENSDFTAPILERLEAKRVVLVTNWFHAPRSLAVFRKGQPQREFAVSFEPKPEPLTQWDRGAQRRERLAAVFYLFRYGVWSW
jgi:uncharacterized SAM-binding protein YcdF (DUF218 family)